MANEATRTPASSHVTEALNVLVLHTLDQSGPLSGYRIATLLDRFVGPKDASLDLPTLYSAILQQKQRGLVSVSFEPHEGRRVRTYALTPRGLRYLRSAKVAWAQSASLLSGLLEEQDRQRRELELAREVQAHFLPSLAPAAGLDLDIAGRYQPAREVGGDYYDVIRLSDTAVALALGDVSGKGIAAALLMATLRAFVRSQPGNPAQLASDMTRLNYLLHESCTRNRFASLFYAVSDVTHEHLLYVNAGHPPPVLLGPGANATPTLLRSGGPVLGLLPDCTYDVGCVTFSTGSVLVAYSDGLSEACSPNGADWGDEGVTAAVSGGRRLPASALADSVLAAVTRFTAGAPQQDDMTLLVARRTDSAVP
jgi:sigma-B regulation protein RsbU (phosphoserine phosphatase)